ncbi:hypothetical protein TNCT_257851 [Trichonephila clavata]|uniref:Uncharacterized protein n=1 Tax=Trichonephila clavata TaxID=2740835 RepID=A0A8X6HK02_TRICU|nr:hypothetical protein TNCT_257851 [Trichonephila clavata]
MRQGCAEGFVRKEALHREQKKSTVMCCFLWEILRCPLQGVVRSVPRFLFLLGMGNPESGTQTVALMGIGRPRSDKRQVLLWLYLWVKRSLEFKYPKDSNERLIKSSTFDVILMKISKYIEMLPPRTFSRVSAAEASNETRNSAVFFYERHEEANRYEAYEY